jgi:hypothetical protein
MIKNVVIATAMPISKGLAVVESAEGAMGGISLYSRVPNKQMQNMSTPSSAASIRYSLQCVFKACANEADGASCVTGKRRVGIFKIRYASASKLSARLSY